MPLIRESFPVGPLGCNCSIVADPDTLQSLLDKSLVRKRQSRVGPRYWMLETIREYATERLDESSEADDLRRRHAEFFLNFAEEGTFILMDSTWADRVDSELDNVRGALDFGAIVALIGWLIIEVVVIAAIRLFRPSATV